MFTGLITHLGKVSKIKETDKNDTYVGIDIKWNDDLEIGSSVCCNGVCLTLTKIKAGLIFFIFRMKLLKDQILTT